MINKMTMLFCEPNADDCNGVEYYRISYENRIFKEKKDVGNFITKVFQKGCVNANKGIKSNDFIDNPCNKIPYSNVALLQYIVNKNCGITNFVKVDYDFSLIK